MFIDLNEEKFKVSLSLPMQLSFPEYKTFPPSIQFWNTGSSFSFSIVGAIHEISPKLSFLSDFADLVVVSKVLISDYNEQGVKAAVKAVMVFFVQFFFSFFFFELPYSTSPDFSKCWCCSKSEQRNTVESKNLRYMELKLRENMYKDDSLSIIVVFESHFFCMWKTIILKVLIGTSDNKYLPAEMQLSSLWTCKSC